MTPALTASGLENARLYEDMARQKEHLQAAFDTARRATESPSLADVLPPLVKVAAELVGTEASSICLVDGSGPVLELVATHGPEGWHVSGLPPVGRGLLWAQLLDGQVVVIEDMALRNPNEENARLLAAGIRSLLSVALRYHDRTIGVLSVHSGQPRSFGQGDIDLLTQFGHLATMAIENARLFRRAGERTEKLAALSTLTRAISSVPDREAVFDTIARAAITLFAARMSTVWVHDLAGVLCLEGTAGLSDGLEERARQIEEIQSDTEVAGRVVAAQSPEYLRDVQDDARWPNQVLAVALGLRGMACVPMIATEEAVGAICIGFVDPRDFSSEEQELMRLLADHAGIAIETQRAAQSLRAANVETEQLLSSISGILIAVDELDGVTRWNAAAEAAFGISAEQIVGWPFADAPIDWDWMAVLASIGQVRGQTQPTRLDEIRYRRPDGREGVLGLTLNPIATGPGRSAGYLLIGSDITERKTMERQLGQAQRMESIGQLASGVAHEINTPIQFVGDNILFFQTSFESLQRLVRSYQRLRDAALAGPVAPALLEEVALAEKEADVDYLAVEVPRAVTETLDGVKRVATIVGALKEFAHPDSGERTPVDLNAAVRSTLAVASNEIKFVADVELDLGDVPPVLGQPGELGQALLNLIVNAAQAIAARVGKGGERGRIGITTRREGDEVVLGISDTGGGIPEPIRDRIFDPFFTTKAVGQGTGQGLTIVHSVVVDKHGGSLTFESEPGRGTTFFIRLPIDGAGGAASSGIR